MYGGNDKTLETIIADVKKTVIGQDEAVEWLCSLVDAHCERSRIIHQNGVDPLSLPPSGSALLVGSTASGKSHLLKTFAKNAGLLFHPIDAGQMTAEGFRGNNFSMQWRQIADKLTQNPDSNVLVFIDEVDKLFQQKHRKDREGWAGFDLLKPLEGGILNGVNPTGEAAPWELDCDRCIFVLAGAFTGIEEEIKSRLKINKNKTGFFASEELSSTSTSETDLRELISLADLEKWGIPREIIGRISSVKFIKPLNEEALRTIIQRNTQDQFAALLSNKGTFSIDSPATELLVKRALAAEYGARTINRDVYEVLLEKVWRETQSAAGTVHITLTTCGDELDVKISQPAQSSVKSDHAAPRKDRLYAQAAYSLLNDVHEHVQMIMALPTFDFHTTLGASCTSYAATVLCKNEGVRITSNNELHCHNDFSLAEISLLYALYTLLTEWFPQADQTPAGLTTLLSLADTISREGTPLDLLFHQIESGKTFIPNPDADSDKDSPRFVWADSLFTRNSDGIQPAHVGGLKPSQDAALGYYREFKGYPFRSQQWAITSLAFRLL